MICYLERGDLMSKKKILIVGMVDSIHLARWLKQFSSSDIQFLVFPSNHYRSVHPNLKLLQSAQFRIFGYQSFRNLSGYFDSLLTLRFLNSRIGDKFRRFLLRFTIATFKPTIIHAIEIQHAGYLIEPINLPAVKRILTNWGSDIYYFQHFDDHKKKIISALNWATHYSAECERDYELASLWGFSGTFLPKIPNAGGFDIFESPFPCSDRKLILVKTYGGQFGAGDIAIRAIQRFIYEYPESRIHFYSVTPDLEDQVRKIEVRSQGMVTFSTLRKPLKHEELMTLFQNARIYLGCSKSDGLSTSFLQAVCTGSYPIQTNTSCAQELVDEGVAGSIIKVNEETVLDTLRQVHRDSALLDAAQKTNFTYARTNLSVDLIESRAKSFYDI